jgi:hypothetical protein
MVNITFLTKIKNNNGSMALKIYDKDILVFEEDSFDNDHRQISFTVNWPSVITIYSSNKNNGDTVFHKGKVVADKAVEIVGILMSAGRK